MRLAGNRVRLLKEPLDFSHYQLYNINLHLHLHLHHVADRLVAWKPT